MTKKEFRVLLDLMMASNPWPIKFDANGTFWIFRWFLDKEAWRRGYANWEDAYKRFKVKL